MLYKLINEHSIWDVAYIFDQPRGFIQSLFTSSTSFASCLVYFTNVWLLCFSLDVFLCTICRQACFGVLRLINAVWYTSISAVTNVFIPMNTHVVQQHDTNSFKHAQSVMGSECSKDHKEVSFTYIFIYICERMNVFAV